MHRRCASHKDHHHTAMTKGAWGAGRVSARGDHLFHMGRGLSTNASLGVADGWVWGA